MTSLEQHHELKPTNPLPPLATTSWGRRLQHVSLRTKIVVPMVALAVLPALATGLFTITWTRNSLHESAIQRVEFDTDSKARGVQEFLRAVQQDLRFLAQTKVIRDLADALVAAPTEGIDDLRSAVEREFLIFSQGKRSFYQVRYLNAAGRELVRLNVEDGVPVIVPSAKLQDKSDRYYVKAALDLEPGQVFISPMDLNVEFGKVEVPNRGVVRYATPVSGKAGEKRGLLIINLNADYLLSLVGPLSPGTEGWLVDEQGTYLGYVGESQQRRALYSLEKRRHLRADHAFEAVSSILNDRQSEQTLEAEQAILSFAPIKLETALPGVGPGWILLIAHQRAPIDAPIRQLTVFLSVVTAAVATIAGVLGALVGHYLTRPVAILRRATREIVADLSKHVEITTGDEIEGLANDFNVMTERLREAQEQLSAWNAELEREVARKTDDLHRLQAGLGKAEKLASIGQMTASVMHEIGNPLAAIKTKIQVAEEDESLGGQCRALLSDIISEVDRLAIFLRSFSRLARLREPRMEDVSPEAVVQGVIILITPELRRRGVSLHVKSAGDAPRIHGDPDQLRQLLINLLLNAAEASSKRGDILVRVGSTTSSRGKSESGMGAIIEVVDKGLGMSSDTIDRIWDPFFTTKSEGTGLGLAICRQIVEDHGGTIHVESEPGEGTVVTVVFPAGEEKEFTLAAGARSGDVSLTENE